MTMPKILMCLAILAWAAIVESKPTSEIEKTACVGCTPLKIVTRAKRCVGDIISSVGEIFKTVVDKIHELRAERHRKRNIFIRNGHYNYNDVITIR